MLTRASRESMSAAPRYRRPRNAAADPAGAASQPHSRAVVGSKPPRGRPAALHLAEAGSAVARQAARRTHAKRRAAGLPASTTSSPASSPPRGLRAASHGEDTLDIVLRQHASRGPTAPASGPHTHAAGGAGGAGAAVPQALEAPSQDGSSPTGGTLLGSFGGPLPQSLKSNLGGGYMAGPHARGSVASDEHNRAQRLAAARAAVAEAVADVDGREDDSVNTAGPPGGRRRPRRQRAGAASAGVRRHAAGRRADKYRLPSLSVAEADGDATEENRVGEEQGTEGSQRWRRPGGSYSARVRRTRSCSTRSDEACSTSAAQSVGVLSPPPGPALAVLGERPAQPPRTLDPARARAAEIARARREAVAARRAELRLRELRIRQLRQMHMEAERAAILYERRMDSLVQRAVAAGLIDETDEDPELALALALSTGDEFGSFGGPADSSGGDGMSDIHRLEQMLGLAAPANAQSSASNDVPGPLGLRIGVVQLLGGSAADAARVAQRVRHAREQLYTPEEIDLSYEALCELEDVVVPTPADVLARLPITTAEAGDDGECNVCLLSYEAGDRVRSLPCAHKFHVDCVDTWLERSKNCPVCKADVVEAAGEAGRAEAPANA